MKKPCVACPRCGGVAHWVGDVRRGGEILVTYFYCGCGVQQTTGVPEKSRETPCDGRNEA